MATQTAPRPASTTGAAPIRAGAARKADVRKATVGALLESNTPFIVWGPPGIGKTRMIEAAARALGWHTEVVLGSIREPQDIAGFPAIAGDGTFSLLPPDYLQRIITAVEGGAPGALLFLDEVSNCSPPQQAALLRVATDRVVGDTRLPDSCRIVFAANPAEQAADGWDLSAPMANRMTHLHWDAPDHTEWIPGLLGGWGIPDDKPEPLRSALVEARGLVAGFISHRPQLLHALPKGTATAGGAWPSPRSWCEHVIPALAATSGIADRDLRAAVERDIVVGAVGQAAALEFLAWRQDQDLIAPDQVLDRPGSFELPDRADKLHAILAAVAATAIGRGTTDAWSAAWAVLGRVADAGQTEVAAVAARALIQTRPAGAPMPPEIAKFSPMLRAAGLLAEAR